MEKDKAEKKYHSLFENDEDKAKAFDKIAEHFYYSNFGTMNKSDVEVLMFSIYLERILDKNESEIKEYSDYTLSKSLGITQQKVSNLKVKKELLYPYEKFEWKQSLLRISKNAIYEDGKIKLYIPDRNLYLEIKNAIEESFGYVEVQLTPNLLQVRLEFFIDLLLSISDDEDRQIALDKIREKLKTQNLDVDYLNSKTFGQSLTNQAPELLLNVFTDVLPIFGGVVNEIGKSLISAIRSGTNLYKTRKELKK